MASYNSILRHVSMTDVKRNTWKLQEQKRIDEQRRQEELDLLKYKNSPLYSDWRFDLSEDMTTQAMTYATTLPGEGDTNLETAISSAGINANSVPSGENATVTTRGFDVTKYTTIKFNVSQLTSGTQALRLFANYGSDPNQFYILRNDLKANPIVTIQSYYANRDNFKLQIRSFNEDPGNMATYRVSASFQRRTPITVFVAIDNPEASAFVRTGGFSEYSNEEKKKQLEQMMKASDEYLFSVYGDLFPGTGAVGFDDVQDVTSWEQAAQGGDPYNIRWPKNSDVPKTKQYYDKHMKQWVTAPVKKASSGGGDETGKKKQPVVAHYEPDGEVIMDVPYQKISFSDFRLGSLKDVNENMTVAALTYATEYPAQGDTALDSAAGWHYDTIPGANPAYGGVTFSGNELYIDAGNIHIGETGGGLQQAIASSKAMDTRNYDTARVTVTKTYDAGDDTDLRIFSNYGSDPNTFYISAFFDDNYYPLTGNTGVREFAVGGSRSNADAFQFQVRSIKNKTYDSESGTYVDAPTSRYTVKIELLRRYPISVFVALDSPEAVSFIRTDEFASLTSEEKKKKLQEMLEAGDAYLLNQFGEAFPGTNVDMSFDDVALPDSWETAGALPRPEDLTPDQLEAINDAVEDAAQNDPEFADFIEALGVAGKTYIDYITGNLPDTIDNDYLGQEYVNMIFRDAYILPGSGNVVVGDNVVGSGGVPTYDPVTGLITIPFNYDFDTNAEAIGKEPELAQGITGFFSGIIAPILGGPYGVDSSPIVPAGWVTTISKELGGATHRPGEVTMSADELADINPLLHDQLVPKNEQLIRSGGTIMENKKIKSPKAFFKDKDIKPEFPENPPPPQIKGLHPDLVTGEKTAQRFNKLDPISARAMPRTGIKSVDKKVQIAKKKPK